jgi:RNA polymerase sigma factor (sigma-70 family)
MILHYSDSAIICGIREKNEKCIKYVMREYLPLVRSFVERNSGTQKDVEDIFQDSLIVLYCRCQEKEFTLSSSLKTYFFAIGKNLWLQRLERKNQLLFYADFEVNEEAAEYGTDNPDLKEFNLARMKLFRQHLESLPIECRMILTLFTQEKTMAEIAGAMGYSNEDTAKSRKYACKNMLVKRIKNDPRFKQFIGYE